jgi:hypothetical protein
VPATRDENLPPAIGSYPYRRHTVAQRLCTGQLSQKRKAFATPFRVEPLQPQSHVAESDEQ